MPKQRWKYGFMHRSELKRNGGFTLVELLIVIAIIGLLAGFLLPAISTARERARRTNCLSNLRQLAIAFEMYADDWYEVFPSDGNALFTGRNSIFPDYINTPQIFWCPSSVRRGAQASSTIENNGILWTDYTNPSHADFRNPDFWNNWYASYAFVFGLTTSNRAEWRVPMISDRGVYNASRMTNAQFLNEYANLPAGTDLTTGNHTWGINTLYLDGSASWVPVEQVVFSEEGLETAPAFGHPTVACQEDGFSLLLNRADTTDDELSYWGQ